MAKKKKKGKAKDARGYSQGGPRPHQPAASKCKAASVSTQAHNEMKELLNQFDSENGDTPASNKNNATTAIASDRFITKLTNIVMRLDELGFMPSQVESVVSALGYEITLESAFDWLCLNVPTSELPPLFTDGTIREDLGTVTTAESLVVVQESASELGEQEELRAGNVLEGKPTTSNSKSSADNGTVNRQDESEKLEREREKEEQKKRLLLQYQYEENDGECDEEDNPPQPQMNVEADVPSSPEEQRLKEEEKALAELEADLNNDANNYMRSKAEIKELRNQAKRMRQQVAGLRRKAKQAEARRRRLEREKAEEGRAATGDVAAGAGGDNKEEESTFDIFGSNNLAKEEREEEAAPAIAMESPPPPTPEPEPLKMQNFIIPAAWTGNTPQKKLEEVLKKRKLPRARYDKLPANSGLRLTVTIDRERPPEKWEARSVDFCRGSSLKDYLAEHALYAIDATVQLYRIFPGPFRDLWLSWMNEVKEEREDARRVADSVKQQRIEHLLSLIPTKQTDRRDVPAAKEPPQDDGEDEQNEGAILTNWDDDSVDDQPVTEAPPSDLGKKMQTEFSRRQSTPSYRKMSAVRGSLPMASYRSTLLETVRGNNVTILCAETGAGKSTQCGQYLLERALLDGRGDAVSILCTQPRRVAATSLAERVADEMCDELGGMVGYQIRMESRRSARTRLLFCTTGVVLRRLQDDPLLTGVSHVLVDEVHERQQQIDVLLIILRQLLRTTRPDLKVVLMSATMETELFVNFFEGAPMISVPGRTFPVASYHLEDLLDATGHVIEEGSRYSYRESYRGDTASLWVTGRGGEKRREVVDLYSQVEPGGVSDAYTGYRMTTRRSMERVNEEVINYDLIEDVLKLVAKGADGHGLEAPDGVDISKGSILIFLPGMGEIKTLIERLEGSRLFRDRQRFDLMPLHSTLTSRDQRRAFIPSKPGCRKIICATNIAETSVTIPDVVCVIDSGRVREVRQNKRTSTSMLVTDWCPKSSAKQRQGRAGRVQPGICLKLYSSATAESIMKMANEPELRRVPLEEICMTILASNFATSCTRFLDQAPQPPSVESVQAAVNTLSDVGAIERNTLQAGAVQVEKLTALGKHLAKLPVDVKIGKILIFGALFRCIDPILTIAASLSCKSPFSTFAKDEAVAKAAQRAFADPDSDFLTFVNVWEAYSQALGVSPKEGRRFCQENYLNHIALREIGDARRQFLDLLCGIGFLDRSAVMSGGHNVDRKKLKSCSFNVHARKIEVVHSVVCAGLYPNVSRLERIGTIYTMYHMKEQIHFHNSSVNGNKKRFKESDNWVIYYEKFETRSRTSVSTTAFVHPLSLLLFGGDVVVKHTERTVVVDEWMNVGMPAQTGVMLRELRKKVDILLQRMIETANSSNIGQLDSSMIDGIISILSSS